MKLMDRFNRMLPTPRLTRGRMVMALILALGADAVQVGLGPLGVTFLDEISDVIVMVLTTGLIGFHPLLLPTFVIELVPCTDMLPTWSGCVLAVIALRKREQHSPAPPPSPKTAPTPPADTSVIDI